MAKRRIALIGAGNPRQQEALVENTNEEAVYVDWTFRIRHREGEILRR